MLQTLRISVTTLLLLAAGSLQASTIKLTQEWQHVNYPATNELLFTTAHWDAGGLTGTGVERFPLNYFGALYVRNGINTNFSTAVFTDPPNIVDEGNTTAVYQGGVFQYITNVNNGGAARIAMTNGTTNSSMSIAGSEIIYHFNFTFNPTFELVPGTSVIEEISGVPLPAPAWLFLSGAMALALTGVRRRRRHHR